MKLLLLVSLLVCGCNKGESKPADPEEVWVEVTGPYSRLQLSDLADHSIEPHLQAQPLIGMVGMVGGVEEIVTIWVDPARLAAYDLVIADVAHAITAERVEIPAGRIEVGDHSVAVRVQDELDTASELGPLPILQRADGTLVRLADVATIEQSVEDGIREPVYVVDNVTLHLMARTGASSKDFHRNVQRGLAEARATLPPGVTLAEVPKPPTDPSPPPKPPFYWDDNKLAKAEDVPLESYRAAIDVANDGAKVGTFEHDGRAIDIFLRVRLPDAKASVLDHILLRRASGGTVPLRAIISNP